MRIHWPHDRCVLCLREDKLTEEHLIPRAIGGRLSSTLVCADCNSRLGEQVDAAAKRDPAIALAVHRFSQSHPDDSRRITDGMALVVRSAGGVAKARRQGDEIRTRPERLDDGSLIQPTDSARKNVAHMLKQGGLESAPIQEALRAFDAAPLDTKIESG